jgi:rhodanese-related sulfurtransferase
MADIKLISRDELKQKIDRKDNFYLVEALAPESFRHSHLPGAINVPYDKVREVAPQLLPDKNAEIITYCGSAT